MKKEDFQLLGHDNPLGYPAPVLPVGRLNNLLVACYASDRVTVIALDENVIEFVRHSEDLKATLNAFDYQNDRLFGFSDVQVGLYKIDNESDFFQSLLRDLRFSIDNPFLRLSLAKATGEQHLTIQEVFLCCLHLAQNSITRLIDTWYATQRRMLMFGSNEIEGFYLPKDWRELSYFLTPAQIRFVENVIPITEIDEFRSRQIPPIHFPARDELRALNDARLVEYFLRANPKSPERTYAFETIMAKYMPVIQRAIRQYVRGLPTWESTEDVTSRILFKIYRSLHNWSAQGNLGGYIAAIAKSTTIDVLRHAQREDRYVSREGELGVPAYRARSSDLLNTEDASLKLTDFGVEGHGKRVEQAILLNQLLTEVCRDPLDEVIINDYFINGMTGSEIAIKLGLSRSTIYRRSKRLQERMLIWLKNQGMTSLKDLV